MPRMRRDLPLAALTVAVCSLWMAPMQGAETASSVMPGVQITDAWIRWLPAGLPAGGYLTLRNMSSRPLVLTGASSTTYGTVSLHQSSYRGSTSVMQPVSEITIAPGSTLSFASAGYHIMLEHPSSAVQPGDQVTIALQFAGGASMTALFQVRKPTAEQTPQAPPAADMQDMPGMPDMPGMQH